MRVLENKKIDVENHDAITFLRVEIEDLNTTILEIIDTLFDKSWISKFDQDYYKSSFAIKASATAEYLSSRMKKNIEDEVLTDTGEYIVSEVGRKSVIQELGYLDVPLAELFKKKVVGNPGFDFYSANKEKIIVFGEAKYLTGVNAYGNGMEQVSKFIDAKQDITDITEIDKFFATESLARVDNGEKAYAISFSATQIKSEKLIKNIMGNRYYQDLIKHKEVIFIAVNI